MVCKGSYHVTNAIYFELMTSLSNFVNSQGENESSCLTEPHVRENPNLNLPIHFE